MAPLATMASASAKNGGVIQRNMHGRGVVKAAKGITLTISNEDRDDAIRIIKSLKNPGVLNHGVLKHEIKKQEGEFLGMLVGTLGASKLVNMLTRKRIIRAGIIRTFSFAPYFKQYRHY